MAQLVQILGQAPPVEAPAGGRFYQPELDGLRFYAFLGVFIYHTLPSQASFYRRLHLPLPGLWAAIAKSGASGVDLFFALSAFLITSLLLRERQETGNILAPAVLLAPPPAYLAAVLCLAYPGRRARACHSGSEASLVLRRRLSALCR